MIFKVIAGWISGISLLIGMPLLGVWLSGRPLAPYLEMPMLGYAGYLPFGIECALIAELAGWTDAP